MIKYDADGNVAGIFVKFPKCKSSDLVAGLPNHTHPAFIINGVEQDYILLGKYKAGRSGVTDGALLSLPNLMPERSIGADTCLSRMKMAGSGITGMTIADYGFIKLLAQKNGWVPKGNTAHGQSIEDALTWERNESVSIGTVRTFEGYLYTCLIAHTTSIALRPDVTNNLYWKREKQIGGEPCGTRGGPNYSARELTLNGTGPLDWYLGKDIGNLSDIIGPLMELQHGYRIYDMELQILENNNAADPNADLSAESSAWKAILPNSDDDGYTLVEPGTTGTLHWNYTGSEIKLDTQWNGMAYGPKGRNFNTLVANATRLPYIPSIVKELGLFPTDVSDQTNGYYYVDFTSEERLSYRGAHFDEDSKAGIGNMNGNFGRGYAGAYFGCRPRALM